jgi:hypothetical protein
MSIILDLNISRCWEVSKGPSEATYSTAAKIAESDSVKTALFAVAAFGILLAWGTLAIVGLPITLVLFALDQYSQFNAKEMHEDLEKIRLEALNTSLDLVLTGPNRGTKGDGISMRRDFNGPGAVQKLADDLRNHSSEKLQNSARAEQERQEFAKAVHYVHQKIQMLNEEPLSVGSVDTLRAEVNQILASGVYQTLKDTDCIAVRFLQLVCVKFSAGEGQDFLAKYGRKALDGKQIRNLTDLADGISGHLDKTSFHRDTLIGELFWFWTHPLRAVNCARSKIDPLAYNSHDHNSSFRGHVFEHDGKKIQHVYAPGATGDLIYTEGVIPFLKKTGGNFESRISFQDTKLKGEATRNDKMVKDSEAHPDQFRVAVFGFDDKVKNYKTKVQTFEGITPKTFFGYAEWHEVDAVLQQPLLDVKLGLNMQDILESLLILKSEAPSRDQEKIQELIDYCTGKEIPYTTVYLTLRDMECAADRFLQLVSEPQDEPELLIEPKKELREVEGYSAFIRENLSTPLEERSDKSSGMYIPHEVLHPTSVGIALEKSQEFFEVLHDNGNNAHWQEMLKDEKHGEERIARMMALGTDLFLSLAILYQSFEEISLEQRDDQDSDYHTPNEVGACKQDIDRGPVENAGLQILFLLAEKGKISQEEYEAMAGAILTRAPSVEGRNILLRRYKILDDLLRFIDSADQPQVQNLLKSYSHSLTR